MPVKAAASAAPRPRAHPRNDRNRPFKSEESNRHFNSNNSTTNNNNNNNNNNSSNNSLHPHTASLIGKSTTNGTSSGAVIRAQVISTAPAPSGKSFLEALRTTKSQREATATAAATKADTTPTKEAAVEVATVKDSPVKEHKSVSAKATPKPESIKPHTSEGVKKAVTKASSAHNKSHVSDNVEAHDNVHEDKETNKTAPLNETNNGSAATTGEASHELPQERVSKLAEVNFEEHEEEEQEEEEEEEVVAVKNNKEEVEQHAMSNGHVAPQTHSEHHTLSPAKEEHQQCNVNNNYINNDAPQSSSELDELAEQHHVHNQRTPTEPSQVIKPHLAANKYSWASDDDLNFQFNQPTPSPTRVQLEHEEQRQPSQELSKHSEVANGREHEALEYHGTPSNEFAENHVPQETHSTPAAPLFAVDYPDYVLENRTHHVIFTAPHHSQTTSSAVEQLTKDRLTFEAEKHAMEERLHLRESELLAKEAALTDREQRLLMETEQIKQERIQLQQAQAQAAAQHQELLAQQQQLATQQQQIQQQQEQLQLQQHQVTASSSSHVTTPSLMHQQQQQQQPPIESPPLTMEQTPLPAEMAANNNNYSMPVSGNTSMSNVQAAPYQDWNQDRWGVNSSISGDANTVAPASGITNYGSNASTNNNNISNNNLMMNANMSNTMNSASDSRNTNLAAPGGYDMYASGNTAGGNNFAATYNAQAPLPPQPQQQMRNFGNYRASNYMQQGGMNMAPAHHQQQPTQQQQQQQAPQMQPLQQQARGYGNYRASNYMQQGGMNMAPAHHQQQPTQQQQQQQAPQMQALPPPSQHPMHMQGQGNIGYNRPLNVNALRGPMLNNSNINNNISNNNVMNADGGMMGVAGYNSRGMQQQGYMGNSNSNSSNNLNMGNQFKGW